MLKIKSIGQAVQKLSSGYTQTDTQTALDLVTFTSEHDLDMVVTYLHAKKLGQWVKRFKSYHLEKKPWLL